MTAPAYWNTTALETVMPTPTAATLIAELIDQLTVQLPVDERWTLVSSGIYESPAEPGGKKIRLAIADLGASGGEERLTFTFGQGTEWGAPTRIYWRTGIDSVHVLSGPFHVVLVTTNSSLGTSEVAFVCALDCSPLKPNATSVKVVGRAPRNSVGTAFWFNLACTYMFMNDADGVQIRLRVVQNYWFDTDEYYYQTVDGQELHSYVPVAFASPTVIEGALYQMALVNRDVADFSVVSLRVDQGVDGNFRVLPLLRAKAVKLAVRIPD